MIDQWRKSVALITGTDRVPVLEYLRPAPRRKSLGSAIVAVFVATFTMLSAVWTVFGLVATGLVGLSGPDQVIEQSKLRIASNNPFRAIMDASELELLSDKAGGMGNNDDRINDLLERIDLLTKRIEEIEATKATKQF
ncbi:hypothetical protein R3P38DRAFT_3239931 [Favolaschia claudopus]|uniref:Uncharacterized protein n=1 Tax=Favolaschia claudopus TaxID=2862362 RepID=A0AAV9Z735_9AGAR